MTYSHKDFEWKNKYDLYFKTKKIATLKPIMFQINWPDGTKSDIYNLTRVKDNAIKEYCRDQLHLDSQESP